MLLTPFIPVPVRLLNCAICHHVHGATVLHRMRRVHSTLVESFLGLSRKKGASRCSSCRLSVCGLILLS